MISAPTLSDSTWSATRSVTSLTLLAALIASTAASPIPAPRRGGKVRIGGSSDDLSSPVFYLSYESGTILTSAGRTISGIWVPDGQTSATTPCTFWADGEPLDYHRRSCKSPTLQWWLWAAIAVLVMFVLYGCLFGKSKEELEQEKGEAEAAAQEAREEGQAGDAPAPEVVGDAPGEGMQAKPVQ